MKWLARMIDHLRGKQDPLLERADVVSEALVKGDIKIVIVAKNARALAELCRLDSHARR